MATGNLPQLLTSFIGREREGAEVKRLLARARLLTLTGPGGSGKTRLALRVAADLSADYPGGLWLVELAALTDAALVAHAVAVAVGVREEPGRPLVTTLANYFERRTALLLLDNCEHLAAACAALVDALLRACPNLRVLATSRQPLGVGGEVAWAVPTLQTPDPARAYAPAELLAYEAVQLFVERAQLARADFAITAQNSPAVARLTRRLDGIPLALELAAARVKVLSVEGIESRLDERFRLLSAPQETLLPRQQTLMALMDWSYDLLAESERELFRALAVFAGSFSFDAVRAVVVGRDEYELIELLSHLSDKSLLLVEDSGGEARYRLLETIREYALGKLDEAGDLPALRRRHRDLYITLAELSEDELRAGSQADWLSRLEAEHDNLRAALEWSRHAAQSDPAETEAALRLAGALVWFWYFRGFLSEGREWLESVLTIAFSRSAPARTLGLAKTLNAAGALAFLQSDYPVGRSRLEESLIVWRHAGDERGAAFALAFLARVMVRQGHGEGGALAEESAAIFRSLDDRWGLALVLDFLGELAREAGDSARAAAHHDESLQLYRALGHKWGIALELSNLGRLALAQHDFATARARLEEALLLQRQVGDKWSQAWILQSLGTIARAEADTPQAAKLYAESLALFEELGEKGGIARAHQMLAELDTPDQAPIAAPQTAAPANGEVYPADLTRREVEVLRLLAEGLTDNQIAARLYLSTRTVQAHLRSIYSKLDLTTRSGATRFAFEHGLT